MTQRKIKRVDPTRTATIRRMFVSAIKRRFRLVKGAIIKLIDDEDALGLKKDAFNLVGNAFCPTGEGGGVDPTCSPAGSSALDSIKAEAAGIKFNHGTIKIDRRDYDKIRARLDQSDLERMKRDLDAIPERDRSSYDEREWLTDFFDNNKHQFVNVGEWYYNENESMRMIFRTSSGRHFHIHADKEARRAPKHLLGDAGSAVAHGYEVSFADEEGSLDKTGKGEAVEIFRRVNAAISALVKEESPAFVTFSAAGKKGENHTQVAGGTRQRLYDRLVKTVAVLHPRYRAVAVTREKGTRDYALYIRELLKPGNDHLVLPPQGKEEMAVLVNQWVQNSAWGLTTNAGQWKFESTPQKVKSFQTWLKKQFADKLHGADDNKLWETYINAGFKKGAARAFEDVNKKAKLKGLTDDKKLAWYQGSKSQFLQSSFANPVSVDKVKLLAGRTFSDLEGITQAMSTKISRTLTDGLVQGKSPHDIAKDLVDSVGIEEARASTLARTELIRAHAEGQLQALEEMGVEEVGVEVEWTVTPDEKLCPECEAMAEVVLPIAEAKGMIPRHPNCRCAWIPANVGEDKTGQKSGKAAEKAIEVSFGKDDEDDDEGWGPTKNAGWIDLVDNVFCATGPGGGVDPTCGKGEGGGGTSVAGHLKSKSSLKIDADIEKKLNWANPNGMETGVVIVPKKLSDSPEKVNELLKHLPPGTVIKQVSFKTDTLKTTTPEAFAKQGKVVGTVAKTDEPKAEPLVQPKTEEPKVEPKTEPQIPKTTEPPTSSSVHAAKHSARQDVWRHNENSPTEKLVLLDHEGNMVETTTGTLSGVDPSESSLAKLKDPTYQLTAIHNHPRGSSLSQGDVTSLVNWPGLKSIEAVTKDGTLYAAQLGPKAPSKKEVMSKAYEKAYSTAREKLLTQRDNGKIYQADVDRLVDHHTMMILHKKELITYTVSHKDSNPTANSRWTDLVDNAFCATGAGGGIDNSCSAHGGGIGASIDAHIGANTYENFAKAGNKIQHTQKALQDIAKSLGLKTSVNVMKDSDFNAFVDAGAKAVGVNPSLIRAVYKPNADTANFRESTINKIQSADDHRLFLQTAYHELGHAYDAKVLGRKADYGHTKATTSMSAYDNSKAEAFADAFGSRMILAQKKITGVGKYPKTWKDKTTKQIIEETKDVV